MRSGAVHVLALDPGGHTGWALYSADFLTNGLTGLDDASPEFYNETILQGQMGPEKHHLELYDFLGMQHTTNFFIVCESFEYRQDQRPNVVLISKEYIGVVELFTQERNRTLPDDIKITHVPQTAATGKGFWYPKVKGRKDSWDGSKLKAAGLYTPTTDGRHINDATAHLLHWLTFGPWKRKEWLLKLRDAGIGL